MCGAPERLHSVRCAHFPSVITTIMDRKVQLLKPLNLFELFTTYSRAQRMTCHLTKKTFLLFSVHKKVHQDSRNVYQDLREFLAKEGKH
jgi:hypothetical protein